MSDSTRPAGTVPCPACGESAADAEASEPVTHCEWCGAEYPVPGEETEAGQEA
jgi:uncharacterized protein (DUF983 family)